MTYYLLLIRGGQIAGAKRLVCKATSCGASREAGKPLCATHWEQIPEQTRTAYLAAVATLNHAATACSFAVSETPAGPGR